MLLIGSLLAAIGGYLMFRTTESSLRESVVEHASAEIGNSIPTKYWKNVLPTANQYPPSWCGAFALWALHQAGLAKDINWIIGIGFLFKLPQTTAPKIGDIAYFSVNQHHAVVSAVNTDGTVSLINGNGQDAKVSLSKIHRNKVTAFYSIQPLIAKVLNA